MSFQRSCLGGGRSRFPELRRPDLKIRPTVLSLAQPARGEWLSALPVQNKLPCRSHLRCNLQTYRESFSRSFVHLQSGRRCDEPWPPDLRREKREEAPAAAVHWPCQ